MPAKVVVAGVSAMVSLRGRLRRPWQSPVFTCFLGIASSLMLLAMTAHSFAQSTQKAPHEANAVETGVITGTLLKDGKSPLGGHIVTLEILNGHQLILTLPKQTDTKGSYQFKNIFQSPEFSYAVSTEFEGKTYRTNFVSLKEGEKSKKLDIAVGSSAKEGPPLPPPMNGEEIFPSPLVGEGRGEGELHR
ncbi:MAG: hypothetical protein HYU98_00780, partial [Deltaproteobacteria bacterium]|nr:hypothetical protein [Deltaproteobacteria bacterium]